MAHTNSVYSIHHLGHDKYKESHPQNIRSKSNTPTYLLAYTHTLSKGQVESYMTDTLIPTYIVHDVLKMKHLHSSSCIML